MTTKSQVDCTLSVFHLAHRIEIAFERLSSPPINNTKDLTKVAEYCSSTCRLGFSVTVVVKLQKYLVGGSDLSDSLCM